ncbi:MAG: hypothetical protein J7621_14825, partial [Niastella sp.]|nr:hypothetical protein [Niastella sp.]
VHIAIHNIPQAIKVKIDEKSLPFNDQEEFTALVSDLLSKIDFSGLPGANIQNLEAFFASFGVPGGEKSILKGASQDQSECQTSLQPFVKRFSQSIKRGYITFPPDTSLFEDVAVNGPLYRTQLDPITAFEAPYRDSITIKAIVKSDSTVDAAKTYVKVGKLRFIQLAAGIAVAKEPISLTKIDTAGNGFKVSTSDNRARAIFGVKIYPFRNYNRDHSIIPRYPLRRLSVMGAFDMLHPLDNFYIGGAYDIVPGLAFSVGANYYLETRHRVENNVIVNTSRSYEKSGAYYSVSVNPVLFVQFVKLFFKTL